MAADVERLVVTDSVEEAIECIRGCLLERPDLLRTQPTRSRLLGER